MRILSDAALALTGQPMFRLIDRAKSLEAQGQDIIHLEIGDPDFATPKNIVDAAVHSLRHGDTHYVSSWGLPDLIEAVQETTFRTRKFQPATEQIVVTPGANISIFYAILATANPGDEVLVPDPGFPTYLSALQMCGVKAVPYPLDKDNGFGLDIKAISERVTDRTRMLIVTSPNNPTGSMATQKQLEEVYALAVERDFYIFSDEIYSRMVFDPEDFFSVASLDGCRERVILSNGFSKAFAMTGWRLGVVVAPPILAERFMLILQTTSSCVSPFVQRGGIEAIRGSQDDVGKMMEAYRQRRDQLVSGLNSIPGINCNTPKGAFYAFPDVSEFGKSSQGFADFMLEEAGVALLPGSDFGQIGEGFVRIAYASSEARLGEALSRISKACSILRGGKD
jgi:aspartate/methionine/tyrosine aminotransferase